MRRVLLLVGGLLLLAYLATGVTEVRPGERAVVRRFGRVLDDKPGPGLWIGLPWGMDRVDRVSVDSVRRVVVGYREEEEGSPSAPPGQLLTGDHNLVNVQVVVDYRVREKEVADFVVQADRADSLVARVTESALAEWVGGRAVDDVLLHGKALLPGWVVATAQERLDRRPGYRLGVEVQQAHVAYLFPPQEVKEAFDEVARAQARIRTKINNAEQEREKGVRKALSEKYRLEQQTAAYAREQVVRARAEAASFEARLEKYRRLGRDNPAYLTGIWLEEVSRLFAQLKKNGQVDLLDRHLSGDGLDLTVIQPPPSAMPPSPGNK
jgi:membrane protease subunit HflK